MMPKLKCKCGGETVLNVKKYGYFDHWYSISCLLCGRHTGYYLTQDGAIAEWKEKNNA